MISCCRRGRVSAGTTSCMRRLGNDLHVHCRHLTRRDVCCRLYSSQALGDESHGSRRAMCMRRTLWVARAPRNSHFGIAATATHFGSVSRCTAWISHECGHVIANRTLHVGIPDYCGEQPAPMHPPQLAHPRGGNPVRSSQVTLWLTKKDATAHRSTP